MGSILNNLQPRVGSTYNNLLTRVKTTNNKKLTENTAQLRVSIEFKSPHSNEYQQEPTHR